MNGDSLGCTSMNYNTHQREYDFFSTTFNKILDIHSNFPYVFCSLPWPVTDKIH